ncbi:uncharacterized protein [Amphiura filiformis]|uniref:uncharacterized protein n=1 Tax=Amphiura filiformis TaxID=82378 RepID=UPI003B220B0E
MEDGYEEVYTGTGIPRKEELNVLKVGLIHRRIYDGYEEVCAETTDTDIVETLKRKELKSGNVYSPGPTAKSSVEIEEVKTYKQSVPAKRPVPAVRQIFRRKEPVKHEPGDRLPPSTKSTDDDKGIYEVYMAPGIDATKLSADHEEVKTYKQSVPAKRPVPAVRQTFRRKEPVKPEPGDRLPPSTKSTDDDKGIYEVYMAPGVDATKLSAEHEEDKTNKASVPAKKPPEKPVPAVRQMSCRKPPVKPRTEKVKTPAKTACTSQVTSSTENEGASSSTPSYREEVATCGDQNLVLDIIGNGNIFAIEDEHGTSLKNISAEICGDNNKLVVQLPLRANVIRITRSVTTVDKNLTERCLQNATNEPRVQQRISTLLLQYDGEVGSVEKGSIVFNLRFSTAAGFKKFWADYKSGKLADQLTQCFLNHSLEEQPNCEFRMQLDIPESLYIHTLKALESSEGSATKSFVEIEVATSSEEKKPPPLPAKTYRGTRAQVSTTTSTRTTSITSKSSTGASKHENVGHGSSADIKIIPPDVQPKKRVYPIYNVEYVTKNSTDTLELCHFKINDIRVRSPEEMFHIIGLDVSDEDIRTSKASKDRAIGCNSFIVIKIKKTDIWLSFTTRVVLDHFYDTYIKCLQTGNNDAIRCKNKGKMAHLRRTIPGMTDVKIRREMLASSVCGGVEEWSTDVETHTNKQDVAPKSSPIPKPRKMIYRRDPLLRA